MASTLSIEDGISPELLRLAKKARNLTPAMRVVESRVLAQKKAAAWQASGIKSDTGELEESVTTWHGKKSAGVTVKTRPGHDKVIPKATVVAGGARKHQYRRHARVRVKQHRRAGRRVAGHVRANRGAPWGNVQARPFVPGSFSLAEKQKIQKILTRYLGV